MVTSGPSGQSYRRPRILVECTTTHTYGGNSGIQRVVRNVVNNAHDVGEELSVRVQPVLWSKGRFLSVEGMSIRGCMTGRFLRIARRAAKTLAAVVRLLLVPALHLPRRRRTLPQGRACSATRVARSSFSALSDMLLKLSHREIELQEGDILLLLDSSWHCPFWEDVRKAKRAGVRVGVVIYDLIPVHLPETCDATLVHIFRKWLNSAVREADFFIAISQCVRDDFLSWIQAQGHRDQRDLPAAHFRLGAELDKSADGGLVTEEIRRLFGGPRTANAYLTVGTVEPRKKHAYLLDAFELAWSQQSEAILVIVGRIGWRTQDLIHRIRTHAQWQKHLFMFNDLSDTELAFCYANAKAAILPSSYEGFGLPVVEALAHGCPVLASNICAHKEVGGDHCAYFDLTVPSSLANLISRFERTGLLPIKSPASEFTWPDWRQSTRELIEATMAIAQS